MLKIKSYLPYLFLMFFILSVFAIHPKAAYEKDGHTYLQVGDKFIEDGIQYKLLSIGYVGKTSNGHKVTGTAEVLGRAPGNKSESLQIRGLVGGQSYLDGMTGTQIIATTRYKAGAFQNDKYAKYVYAGGHAKKIPKDFCKNCKKLKYIILIGEITEIESGAFNNCVRATEIHFDTKLKKVSKNAFKNCGKKNEKMWVCGYKSYMKKLKKLLKKNYLYKAKNRIWHKSPDTSFSWAIRDKE